MTRHTRILFVENGIGYGGAIICLRHLVRNLDRRRYEPMVLTGRNGPLYEDIANDAAWRCVRDRHIDIPAIRLKLDQSPLLKRLAPLNWLVNQVLSRLDDLFNFLPCLIGTLWLMLRWKPDLVHLNNEPLCNRAALISAWILRIPTISHVRGEQRGSRLMRWLFELPSRFITVSDWIAEGVRKQGVPRERIQRIYDGIELDKLDRSADAQALRKKWGVPEGHFAVGLVGLLIPWKGQKLFLEAGRILLGSHPNIFLVLVGGTPEEYRSYERELRELADAPELKNRVAFSGHIGNMSEAYAALDVVVSASTSPEPLGTVVIESLALGRPLVAPAHGGALEMVEHEKTGLLFRPSDPASLAEQILRFQESAQLRHALGIAAREKALRTFAVAEHVRQTETAYLTLLQRHG